jgi:hypothetical protein
MKLTSALLTLAIATPLFAQVQVTVSKDLDSTPGIDPVFIQEIKLQKTLQAKDFKAFKDMVLPDFVVATDTLQGADEFTASLKKCEFGRNGLENHQIRMLGQNAAVINYRLTSEISCSKQNRGGRFNATTIWVLKDGKWLAQLHTETPIPATQ